MNLFDVVTQWQPRMARIDTVKFFMGNPTLHSILSFFRPNLTRGSVDDSSSSSEVLQVMLELTRQVLGGSEAWLLEGFEDRCKAVMEDPADCGPVPLLGKVMIGRFHREPSPLVVLEDGSHGLCLEVLHASYKSDPFYLVLVKLPARMDLGEREKGLLDGLRCAFAAACIHLPVTHNARRLSDSMNHLVCCAACRRLQTDDRQWTHWDLLADRGAFTKPVSHTVCEACAIKLYGLTLAKDDQSAENETCTCFHSHDNQSQTIPKPPHGSR